MQRLTSHHAVMLNHTKSSTRRQNEESHENGETIAKCRFHLFTSNCKEKVGKDKKIFNLLTQVNEILFQNKKVTNKISATFSKKQCLHTALPNLILLFRLLP